MSRQWIRTSKASVSRSQLWCLLSDFVPPKSTKTETGLEWIWHKHTYRLLDWKFTAKPSFESIPLLRAAGTEIADRHRSWAELLFAFSQDIDVFYSVFLSEVWLISIKFCKRYTDIQRCVERLLSPFSGKCRSNLFSDLADTAGQGLCLSFQLMAHNI